MSTSLSLFLPSTFFCSLLFSFYLAALASLGFHLLPDLSASPWPRCEYILSPSNLILKYGVVAGEQPRDYYGPRRRFMQRSLNPPRSRRIINMQLAFGPLIRALILMNFRFICLADWFSDAYRQENEQQQPTNWLRDRWTTLSFRNLR